MSPPPGKNCSAARGTPASMSSFTASKATSGVCSAGLAATLLPATSAAAIWPMKIASGKFHGEMQTKTPRPIRRKELSSPVGPGKAVSRQISRACRA